MNTIQDSGKPSQGYNLSRKEVLEKYKWREGLISLRLSKHAQRRAEERVDGEFPIVPTMVRITKNNICSGRSGDGKTLTSVKIRLDYKTDKWMFLVICPNSGVVKTLYVNYKDAKREKAIKERAGIKEDCCLEEEYYDRQPLEPFRESEGKRKYGGILEQPMEEVEGKGLLELWKKNIWGKLKHILGPLVGKKPVS